MRQALCMGRAGCLAAASAAAIVLAGCAKHDDRTYQGYVEGEFVYVASPVGGRLDGNRTPVPLPALGDFGL